MNKHTFFDMSDKQLVDYTYDNRAGVPNAPAMVEIQRRQIQAIEKFNRNSSYLSYLMIAIGILSLVGTVRDFFIN